MTTPLLSAFLAAWSAGALSAEQPPAAGPMQAAAEIAPADASVPAGTGAAADSVSAARLAALNDALADYRQSGRDEEALQAAKEILSTLEDQQGSDTLLIEPLRTIADLQIERGETGEAEQTLRRLIALIEHEDSVFSLDLVEPLTLMAELYSRSDRREEAITVLRRARHITHRQLGILNMDQIELAELLVENYFNLSKISDGSRESRFSYRVSRNEFGDSVELVPAINALAAWYLRISEFAASRRYLKQSIGLLEDAYGKHDLRLVDTLKLFALTYRKEGNYKSEGRKALLRAIAIHEANPGTDIVAHARSLTDLADWQIATMRTRAAMQNYRRAWNLLTDGGVNPERGNVFFKSPKRLRYDPPIPDAYRMHDVSEIYVDVDLVINPDGSARDIRVRDSNADWRTQSEVRAAMRGARYRPRFVDGEPVAAVISTRWTYQVPNSSWRLEALEETGDENADETG